MEFPLALIRLAFRQFWTIKFHIRISSFILLRPSQESSNSSSKLKGSPRQKINYLCCVSVVPSTRASQLSSLQRKEWKRTRKSGEVDFFSPLLLLLRQQAELLRWKKCFPHISFIRLLDESWSLSASCVFQQQKTDMFYVKILQGKTWKIRSLKKNNNFKRI